MPRKGEASIEVRLWGDQEGRLARIALREQLSLDDVVQAAVWMFLTRQEKKL